MFKIKMKGSIVAATIAVTIGGMPIASSAQSQIGSNRPSDMPPETLEIEPVGPSATDVMEGAFESDLDGEIPEEILRTEIITAARSPLTGEPLTPAEYAQLLDELERKPATEASVSENIRYIVLLLQIRRAIQPIVPFF